MAVFDPFAPSKLGAELTVAPDGGLIDNLLLKSGNLVTLYSSNSSMDYYVQVTQPDGTNLKAVPDLSLTGFSTPYALEETKKGFALFYTQATEEKSKIFFQNFKANGDTKGKAIKIAADSQLISELSTTELKGGKFLVTYSKYIDSLGDHGTCAQIVSSKGKKLGKEIKLWQDVGTDMRLADVAGTKDGGFALTWESYNGPPASDDIYVSKFDKKGAAITGAQLVNSFTADFDYEPKVAALTDGGFVVTWYGGYDQDGDALGVWAQRYDDMGQPVGANIQVNTVTGANQSTQTVAALPDGGFLVVWQSSSVEPDVKGQRFDANGEPVGSEFLISNTNTTANSQFKPIIDVAKDGGYVVSWESNHNGISNLELMARYFDGVLIGTNDDDKIVDKYGTDEIYGREGGDEIIAKDGDDRAYGGNGGDEIHGGNGQDELRGEGDNDYLNGGKHADELYGDEGDDILEGGHGADMLTGGDGFDTFVFTKKDKHVDTITDYELGADVIALKGFTNKQLNKVTVTDDGVDTTIDLLGKAQVALLGVAYEKSDLIFDLV